MDMDGDGEEGEKEEGEKMLDSVRGTGVCGKGEERGNVPARNAPSAHPHKWF